VTAEILADLPRISVSSALLLLPFKTRAQHWACNSVLVESSLQRIIMIKRDDSHTSALVWFLQRLHIIVFKRYAAYNSVKLFSFFTGCTLLSSWKKIFSAKQVNCSHNKSQKVIISIQIHHGAFSYTFVGAAGREPLSSSEVGRDRKRFENHWVRPTRCVVPSVRLHSHPVTFEFLFAMNEAQ